MTDVVERLERATGPDREIDRAINDALGIDNKFHEHEGYTRSVDSALSLVERKLLGWRKVMREHDSVEGDGWYVGLFSPSYSAIQWTAGDVTKWDVTAGKPRAGVERGDRGGDECGCNR